MNWAVLVMDNVTFHKSDDFIIVIEQNGYIVLFLPPYSPFLNAIENMFSKWKDAVARGNSSGENELNNLIRSGADYTTPADCNEYYRNVMNYIPRCLNGEIIED